MAFKKRFQHVFFFYWKCNAKEDNCISCSLVTALLLLCQFRDRWISALYRIYSATHRLPVFPHSCFYQHSVGTIGHYNNEPFMLKSQFNLCLCFRFTSVAFTAAFIDASIPAKRCSAFTSQCGLRVTKWLVH